MEHEDNISGPLDAAIDCDGIEGGDEDVAEEGTSTCRFIQSPPNYSDAASQVNKTTCHN